MSAAETLRAVAGLGAHEPDESRLDAFISFNHNNLSRRWRTGSASDRN